MANVSDSAMDCILFDSKVVMQLGFLMSEVRKKCFKKDENQVKMNDIKLFNN
jgi:hypothetical protein